MSPTDDPIERAFRPLRTPSDPTPAQVDAVRRQAERPMSTTLRRARPAIALVGLAAVAVAVAVGSAVDRGQPGTFVGEAGAREVLRAAADATRGDAMPTGWQWTRTVTVERRTLEGSRCKGCPTERGVYERSFTDDVWTGDRGEAYRFSTGSAPRAVENEPLLRTTGLLDVPPADRPDVGMHVPAARSKRPGDATALGMPGWIDDPSAVPSSAASIVRWARARVTAQDRAWRKRAREGGGQMRSGQTRNERVASTLVDLATSPQLSGAQKAAAFEALASLAVVTVEEVPSAFADPQRVAVRIAGARTDAPVSAIDRVVVFDRTSFRVVAEQIEEGGDGSADSVIVAGKQRFTMINGGAVGEQRYAAPVPVAAPGLDGSGKRLVDVSKATEVTRDGRLTGAPGERAK